MDLPKLGDILMGKHRIDEVLGEGGFGVVYGATTLASSRPVAIKVLKPGNKGYDTVRAERFMRELRTIARLSNPHTVTLFDYGRTPDGLMFMVCEMVEGEDLTELMHRRGRVSEAETVHVLKQVLDSLKEAHDLGVLHRDIKPANIRLFEYLNDPLRVKVLDFGLAKSLRHDENPLTAAGKVIGTPRYMSPEQIYGRELTPASDLYSLGLVAYEMLLGRNSRALFKVGDKPYLSVADPVSRDVRLAINRMLESEVEDRAKSADEMLEMLRALKLSKPPRPVAPEPAPPPISKESADVATTVEDVDIGPTEPLRVEKPPEQPEPAVRHVEPSSEPKKSKLPLGPTLVVAFTLAAGAAIVVLVAQPQPEPVVRVPADRVKLSPGGLIKKTVGEEPPDVGERSAERPAAKSHSRLACGGKTPFEGFVRVTRAGGGDAHEYDAYVPTSYDPAARHPLVVLFADDEDGSDALLRHSRLDEQADEHGFVIVQVRRGDPKTTLSAVDAAAENLCIDENRLYGIGIETGAAALIASTCAVRFRAIVTGGALPIPSPSCRREVPHLHFVDLADQERVMWMYAPEPTKSNRGACIPINARVRSQRMFEAAWGATDCPSIRGTFEQCRGWDCGAPVILCDVDGGRLWQLDRNDCRGEENRDFPYAARMWAFFDSLGAPAGTKKLNANSPRLRP